MTERIGTFLLLLLSWIALAPHRAFAEVSLSARLAPLASSQTISGLEISDDVVLESDNRVQIRGSFTQPGASLAWKNKSEMSAIKTQKNGDFNFEVKVPGRKFALQLVAVGPTGTVQNQSFDLLIEERPPESHLSITPSLGISYIQYQQTRVESFSLSALTAKLAIQYRFLPTRFDLAGNVFMTALPISGAPAGVAVRFLGINLRAGYALGFIPEPWRLTLMAGLYYSQMMVTGNAFGYSPIIFPQLYPTLRRTLKSGDFLFGYLKYVPLTESISVSTSEMELAGGFGWVHMMNRHPLTVGLDLSKMAFTTKKGTTFDTRTLSLSVGYGW